MSRDYTPRTRREHRRARVATLNTHASKTDQSQAEASDINVIIKRMHKTGYVPPMRGPGHYRDAVLEATDLQTAHIMIQEGSDLFDKLPASTREHFANDPMKLHEFLMDENPDIELGVKLGIFDKPVPIVENDRTEPRATPAVDSNQKTEKKSE